MSQLSQIVSALTSARHPSSIFPISLQFVGSPTTPTQIAQSLNAAFLQALSGDDSSIAFLKDYKADESWATTANFYLSALEELPTEFEQLASTDQDFKQAVLKLLDAIESSDSKSQEEWRELIWQVFFPDGCNLLQSPENAIAKLSQAREVTIKQQATGITNPTKQILFTSNALITVPVPGTDINSLDYSQDFLTELKKVTQEPQLYWYDHPIPIGIPAEQNEILYGLKGLDKALAVEAERGNLDGKTTILLSVSCTHRGLQALAQPYIEDLFARHGHLDYLELYIFTEQDTQKIINKVLYPLSSQYLGIDNAQELLKVFGVDGEYGRHYSFLKAILPLYAQTIDTEIIATFKIDLDQVFPQQELIKTTGKSALEHFVTPLWGATATDNKGKEILLGMFAGALVNQSDINKGIFTPDVKLPTKAPAMDELLFAGKLPQAISTIAEMMTRYDTDSEIDGQRKALQRIHVTGGTNGILLDVLKTYRPFTPSFIGRAEDQAYLLSTIDYQGAGLAYYHAAGLFMRHDKEAFADDAIKHAAIGKLIGDYIRILYFSEYVNAFELSTHEIKELLAPFSGCFISKLPNTVVLLRFAIKAADFFAKGKEKEGVEFITEGSRRIGHTQALLKKDNWLINQYKKEKTGWDLYYNSLEMLETDQAILATAKELVTAAKVV